MAGLRVGQLGAVRAGWRAARWVEYWAAPSAEKTAEPMAATLVPHQPLLTGIAPDTDSPPPKHLT